MQNTETGRGFGAKTTTVTLMPEQIAWLKRKRGEMARPASMILRDLVQAAMEKEEEKRND